MAQNPAKKFGAKVDERFKTKLLTEGGVNNDYDWSGVKTVSVYGIDTVPMQNYQRSGGNRYGDVIELGNTQQDLTLTRDRSFTFSIDQGNFTETQMVARAGEALARELDEVAMPEIDVYRLSAWITSAVANSRAVNTGATTAANAYVDFLAAQALLSDDLVPLAGRIAYMTNQYYAFLKQSGFVVASEQAMSDRKSGDLGEVDGVKIVIVPSSYMSQNANLIIVHPSAMVSPRKIEDFKTHDNPPGINGKLVEGRLIYDAFILNNKKKGIAVHKTA